MILKSYAKQSSPSRVAVSLANLVAGTIWISMPTCLTENGGESIPSAEFCSDIEGAILSLLRSLPSL